MILGAAVLDVANLSLASDWDMSDWVTNTLTLPFEFVAFTLEPCLDSNLLMDKNITDLFPPISNAIFQDVCMHSQTQTHHLLIAIKNSVNKELQTPTELYCHHTLYMHIGRTVVSPGLQIL